MNNLAVKQLADRLKCLPRGHRVAHLRALIALQPEECGRRGELSGLLSQEMSDTRAD